MARQQIVLSEEKLREFISYSVARLLKEAYGKAIYDRNGEYDGAEESEYGEDSFVFEPDIDQYLRDEVDFPSPIKVEVSFTRSEGMKGDGYMQPDDPDDYELGSWRILNRDVPEEFQQDVLNAVKQYMENDFDIEEAANEHGNLYEENKGVTFHNDGKNPFKPNEAGKGGDSKEKKSNEKNKGITAHFNGKKDEKTPEDKENDEHMFDDKYWAKKKDDEKIKLNEQDIAKMVKKAVNEISKGLLDRAREAAHKDMMRNFGDSKTRQKRERQWKKFGDEYRKMDRQEKDSICPQVDERDLVNMPEDTYVIMNGDGRDAVSANFRTSYSGRAGTKEQCEEYVHRFYDSGANWEYLPEILPLKDFLMGKRS